MAFYSLQDTRTPAIVAILSVGINIGLSLWLMTFLAYTGLALAAGLAAIGHTLILATILGKRLQGLLWHSLVASLLRTGISLLPLIGFCTWIAAFPLWQDGGQGPQKMAWLALAISGSAMGYFGIHQLLRSDELIHFKLMLQRKTQKGRRGK